ncbi:hypothetical protein BJY00DRAFT_55829 [Aspergillus carlsbadensis]|nr:hypothetical protein BJY00DRAFT_55829 [Aspergillus carlsbadensis]
MAVFVQDCDEIWRQGTVFLLFNHFPRQVDSVVKSGWLPRITSSSIMWEHLATSRSADGVMTTVVNSAMSAESLATKPKNRKKLKTTICAL